MVYKCNGDLQCIGDLGVKKAQVIPFQRSVLNIINIVISSLLQFTHINTNYATRSNIMSILPGQ